MVEEQTLLLQLPKALSSLLGGKMLQRLGSVLKVRDHEGVSITKFGALLYPLKQTLTELNCKVFFNGRINGMNEGANFIHLCTSLVL